MFQLTNVVKQLIIINVVLFVATHFLGDISNVFFAYLIMYYPTAEAFQPYQVVTHIFMHGNIAHIFFNMYGLAMFGPPLETKWGPKRFLIFYLITGFGATALQMFVVYLESQNMPMGEQYAQNYALLGASGAVFGLLAGYAMEFPRNQISLLFPPITLRAPVFALAYGAIEIFLGVGRFNTGIAHFAHVGGALFGVLLILFWRKRGERLY